MVGIFKIAKKRRIVRNTIDPLIIQNQARINLTLEKQLFSKYAQHSNSHIVSFGRLMNRIIKKNVNYIFNQVKELGLTKSDLKHEEEKNGVVKEKEILEDEKENL